MTAARLARAAPPPAARYRAPEDVFADYCRRAVVDVVWAQLSPRRSLLGRMPGFVFLPMPPLAHFIGFRAAAGHVSSRLLHTVDYLLACGYPVAIVGTVEDAVAQLHRWPIKLRDDR